MRKTLTDRTLFLPLTGLRGLAVIFVLLSHMGYMQLYLIPLPHFSIGKVGVWVFFVLSAFLLTTHLYQDFSTNDSRRVVLSKYAINRIFRIYPLFIVALILHFLVGDITGIQIIKHIFLTMGYFELWAIPVEVKYYFFIPVLAAIASLISLKLACLSIIVLMGIALMYGISNPQSVFSNQLSIIPKLTPFLFGSFSAILYLKGRGRANGTNKFFIVLRDSFLIFSLLILTITYWSISQRIVSVEYAPWLSILLGMIVTGLIISALQPSTLISRILSSPILVFVGKISFSVYLLHMFVIRLLPSKMPFVDGMLLSWAVLAIILVVSTVTYHLIEAPGIKFGKWLGAKLIKL